MGDWHVSIGGQQQSPMSEAALLAAIRAGQVGGQDMVWTEGMANWSKVAEIPTLASASPGVGPMLATPGQAVHAGVVNYRMPGMGPVQCTERGIEFLRRTKPWARLIGVFLIVIGALAAIGGIVVLVVGGGRGLPGPAGIAYIIMAVLYIALGSSLNTYASKIGALVTFRHEDQLEGALEAQMRFWRLSGILLLVLLGIYLLIFIVAIGVGLSR